MADFIANLSSMYWWLSVVIVGVLINVFSTYVQKVLDRRISNTSAWWRRVSSARRARRDREIVRLTEEPNYRFVIQTRMIVDFFLFLASIFISFSILTILVLYEIFPERVLSIQTDDVLFQIVGNIIAPVLMFFSFLFLKSAVNKRGLIEDAFARKVGTSSTSDALLSSVPRRMRERRERSRKS